MSNYLNEKIEGQIVHEIFVISKDEVFMIENFRLLSTAKCQIFVITTMHNDFSSLEQNGTEICSYGIKIAVTFYQATWKVKDVTTFT